MSDQQPGILSTRDLSVRVPGRDLVNALSVEFATSEFIAILGPNGVGKTLAMLTLAGLRPADAGQVLLAGTDITQMKRVDVAQRLALMPQSVDDVFPATVLDTALVGRHPHIGMLSWETSTDVDIARDALRIMDIDALADRDILSLSGGERRRLAVAQILAQQPQVYLLDEPTNHLDPQHQLDVLGEFRARANAGSTVIASLHDVNLAARYADRCLLLHGDGRWALGDAADMLDETRLSELYGTPIEAVAWRAGRLFIATGEPSRIS